MSDRWPAEACTRVEQQGGERPTAGLQKPAPGGNSRGVSVRPLACRSLHQGGTAGGGASDRWPAEACTRGDQQGGERPTAGLQGACMSRPADSSATEAWYREHTPAGDSDGEEG